MLLRLYCCGKINHTTRCRIVKRVHIERGGTTGVLDWRVGGTGSERDAHRRMDNEAHTGRRPGNAEDMSWTGNRKTRTQIYVYKCRRIERLQPIRSAKQMPTPDHLRTQGKRWRYCRKHTGVPRSSTSLPKTCRKKTMENDRGESFGFGPTALRPRQCAIPFSHRPPLFYSSRREAVYIALTHINSLSFWTEIPLDSLPTGYYYLGSDLCTYLTTLYNNVRAHV